MKQSELLQSAISEAVRLGLIKGGEVTTEQYEKTWNAMDELFKFIIKQAESR